MRIRFILNSTCLLHLEACYTRVTIACCGCQALENVLYSYGLFFFRAESEDDRFAVPRGSGILRRGEGTDVPYHDRA